ncbi:hypothetical protein [Nocardia jiangxiensis]|uniref:Uncharacterized protein n=1 Tax=Nocardia jiangxiensis TaxID=282685 RepID=A0ABW6RSD6_9NOCA
MSATTAWRYVEEVAELRAARAPALKSALRRAEAAGRGERTDALAAVEPAMAE